MANILDYIDWRGDLSFSNSCFNEIDNVIFSRFSYLPFDGIIADGEEVSIKEAYERYLYSNKKNRVILQKEDIVLFKKMAESKRYKHIKITRYVNKIDKNIEKQFSAITLILPSKVIYVSFRGTDKTLVGWKEDFNMSFSNSVPSQKSALKYLNDIFKIYNDYSYMLGGHSKGGNLAAYAGIFTNKSNKEKIKAVFNNDGPGFQKEVIESKDFKEIENRIYTFVPQTSIIGRMLYHGKNYQVVKSTQSGIRQHDVYSWQLLGTEFEHLDNLDDESVVIDQTLSDWLENVEPSQREEFINSLYDILASTNVENLTELENNKLENIQKILNSYKNISKENKDVISKTLDELFKSGKKAIKKYLPTVNKKRNK